MVFLITLLTRHDSDVCVHVLCQSQNSEAEAALTCYEPQAWNKGSSEVRPTLGSFQSRFKSFLLNAAYPESL